MKIGSLKNNQIASASIFLLVGFFFLVGLCLINKQIIFNTVYNPHFLKLPQSITTVITGASDVQFGLNQDQIKNAYNIALPAENYFYAYYKLKFLLNSYNKIKNVIIGYNFGSLSRNRERDLTGPRSGQFYKRYFMLLDSYGRNKIFYPRNKSFYFFYAKYGLGIPMEMEQEISLLWNILFNQVSIFDYPFSGTFAYREPENKVDLQNSIKIYYLDAFVSNGTIVPLSGLMFEYLHKIVKLCEDKGVTLILLSTPIHESFLQQVPPYYYQVFYEKIEALKASNYHFHHYDYTTYNLSDDCFIDVVHLNSKGKALFSKEINRRLAADLYSNAASK